MSEIPNRTHDVLLHANGDVRLHAGDPSRSRLNIQHEVSTTNTWIARSPLRRSVSAPIAGLPVTTSTPIPILSP